MTDETADTVAARRQLLLSTFTGGLSNPHRIKAWGDTALLDFIDPFEAAVRADELSKTEAERGALRAALREIDEYKYDDRLPPAATLQAIATRAIAALTEGEQP